MTANSVYGIMPWYVKLTLLILFIEVIVVGVLMSARWDIILFNAYHWVKWKWQRVEGKERV